MGYILLLTLTLFSGLVYSSPAEEPEEFRIPILDRFQNLFGARMNFVANRLDSFFATERADDELGRSRVRIRTFYTMREQEAGDHTTQYRLNLKLPHLEQKFKYEYYQSKPVKESEVKKAKKLDEVKRRWLFNADMGVNATIPPTLTVRGRVRTNFQTGTIINRFVEQLTFITDESGFVHTTSLDSDHSFTPEVLFRFVNSVEWKISQKDFRTQHGPTVLQQITDNDAIRYQAILSTTVDNGVPFVDNYRLGLDYRRNLYRQWLYSDIFTGVDFPKVYSFNVTPYLILQIEMLLGH